MTGVFSMTVDLYSGWFSLDILSDAECFDSKHNTNVVLTQNAVSTSWVKLRKLIF